MTSLEPDMAKKMADVARSRAAAWTIMVRIIQEPTEEFVENLRTGVVRQALEQHTAWVGEDNPMTIHLQSLRAFEGRSGRISLGQDMAVLLEDWNRLENRDVRPALENWASSTTVLCAAEAEGWAKGEIDSAKQARFAQFEDMSEHLQDAVNWAAGLHDGTKVLVRRMLARIYGAHLSIESGRDLLPSIMV